MANEAWIIRYSSSSNMLWINKSTLSFFNIYSLFWSSVAIMALFCHPVTMCNKVVVHGKNQSFVLNLSALALRGYRSSCSTRTSTIATVLVHSFYLFFFFKTKQTHLSKTTLLADYLRAFYIFEICLTISFLTSWTMEPLSFFLLIML